jgi:hypothetical protein
VDVLAYSFYEAHPSSVLTRDCERQRRQAPECFWQLYIEAVVVIVIHI